MIKVEWNEVEACYNFIKVEWMRRSVLQLD